MAEDAATERPFIAAIAISKARGGLPAPGFFDCARRLGRFAGDAAGTRGSGLPCAGVQRRGRVLGGNGNQWQERVKRHGPSLGSGVGSTRLRLVSRGSVGGRPHVVIVGAGFGGLTAAERARQGSRRGHPDRSREPPPVSAAALPSSHRGSIPGGDRLANPGSGPAATQHPGAARRGHRRRS